MAIRNISFDDESTDTLEVFSGQDLIMTHLDVMDLDWEEVTERSILDQRRGLVITQVAVLEELIDEFILYIVDPEDPVEYQNDLDRKTIGPRLNDLERELRKHDLLDSRGAELIADLRSLIVKRNELAHGIIYRTLRYVVPIKELATRDLELEWLIWSRRTRSACRITMSGLRSDLYQAIGCFTALLQWGAELVERAPRPRNYQDFSYLAVQQPEV
jgi:hypothetical protein